MLKRTAIFCSLAVSLLPLATFAGSLNTVHCCQGGKQGGQAVVLACQVALPVRGDRKELAEVSHSDQQMLFTRASLPGQTWVRSQLAAGAVGEVPYTTSLPLKWSILTRHRYVCGLGEQP